MCYCRNGMFLWHFSPLLKTDLLLEHSTWSSSLCLSLTDCVCVYVCVCACMHVPTYRWFSNWPFFFPRQIRKLLEKPKEKVLKKPSSARPEEKYDQVEYVLINNRSPLWQSSCTSTPPHLAQSHRGSLSRLPLFSTLSRLWIDHFHQSKEHQGDSTLGSIPSAVKSLAWQHSTRISGKAGGWERGSLPECPSSDWRWCILSLICHLRTLSPTSLKIMSL